MFLVIRQVKKIRTSCAFCHKVGGAGAKLTRCGAAGCPLMLHMKCGAQGVSVDLTNLCPLHRQTTFRNYAGESDSDASDAVYE